MAEISYTKTNWVNNVTKLNADNMNHIENGIEAATVEINTLNGDLANKASIDYVDNAIASSTVSPTVETETITGGTKVTITDKNGAHAFNVMNGTNGTNGKDGADGTDGTDGITPTIGANGNWYIGNTDTGKPSRGTNGTNGTDGKSAYAYAQDGGFTGTEAQFNNGLSVMGNVSGIDTTVTQNSGNLITSGAVYTFAKAASSQGTPLFAQSVDELNASGDKTKIYLLPDGYLYAWAKSTSQETVTVSTPVNGTPDNPYKDGYRLGSSGDTFHNDATGYTVTPYIDLSPYSGKNINIILEGLTYFTETPTQWVQSRCYKDSSTVFVVRSPSTPVSEIHSTFHTATNLSIDIQSSTKTVMTAGVPILIDSYGNQVLGLRFCAKGSSSQSTITIEYDETQTVTKEQWTNTGVKYSDGDANTVAELNNEGADPAIISLLTSAVKEFYNSPDYDNSDYSTSKLSKITYPYRADIPVPYVVKWEYNEDAMRTILAVSTQPITNLNPYKLTQYEVTGYNKYPIYNLLPATTYYYRVSHILATGEVVTAKSGNFTTDTTGLRLLYIDGTQNVRDLGGWTGLNGKKVKYGKIIRGAALSDSSGANMIVTGNGRLALGELKIQAELNLGAIDNATSIAANCAYKKIGYTNYAIAITGETYRAQFKEVLEWIVSCLDGTLNVNGLYQVQRNIYMHCQGGCDRTGTLAFQLLGLLGVSESDLAKEYEISSFSDVGFGRLRNTTKAVDVYDYVGMVEALKAYSGATITDKFVDFATTGCGISTDTITSFRNLMLE